MSLRNRNSGFSRIEAVVIMGVVATLVGLLVPAVQSAREAARRMSCSNNLKQVAFAFHNYHDTYKRLPSGWLAAHPDDPSGADSWAWSVMIIPFLE
ncbi:MAG: DUF1559 domain-containing protein [Planctomycetes bacterium]|nr:DUF1559 domain-containing protein [Planctomycetota bacterium]